jgi:DnaJ-class molecular chaperone
VGLVPAVRRLGRGAAVSACGSCGGSGTVRVEIYNTATHKTQTITQTCLSCMGSGKS